MNVTVYTKPHCPQCTATTRALDKHGIDHDTVDITTTTTGAREYVQALGHLQAPVVVTDTDHWSGYRSDRCKALNAA